MLYRAIANQQILLPLLPGEFNKTLIPFPLQNGSVYISLELKKGRKMRPNR